MVAGDRRHHQNGVGFFGIQRAVGDVGDRKILDRLAALQFQVAFAKELMRRLLRRMGRDGQRQQQAQTKTHGCEMRDAFHWFPPAHCRGGTLTTALLAPTIRGPAVAVKRPVHRARKICRPPHAE
jgi:hypothetical protein